MKKKFLRGVAAFLAVMMMLPTAALADTDSTGGAGVEAAASSEVSLTSEDGMVSPEGEASTVTVPELIILKGEDNVTDSTVEISDSGAKNTVSLSIKDGYSVTWESSDPAVASVSGGTVTGHKAGSVTIFVYYNKNGVQKSAKCTVVVGNRTVNGISISENNVKKTYNEGESFNTSGITVTAEYSDGTTETVTNYSVSPNGMLRESDTEIKISYTYKDKTVSAKVTGIKVNEVTADFTIESPVKNTIYKVDDKIAASDIEIKVTESDGNVFYLKGDSADVSYSPTGKLTASDTAVSVTYGGVTKSVAIKVEAAATKTISDMYVYTKPTKTLYNVNDTLDLSGLVLAVRYSDDNTKYVTKSYAANSSKISANVSKFTKEGTQTVVLTYKDEYGAATATLEVTVGEVVNVTGFANTSSYKASIDEDAKVKLGDELDWEELFDYVYIKYTESSKTKYKKISDNDDLEDWLGSSAKLYVIVSGKTDDEDIVEEDDVDDGEVALKLYLDYAGTKYSLSFDMEVSDVSCTVTVYRSSTSSTKIGDSKVFDDLKEALEYLEDKEDIIDDFGISSTYKNNFVIKIKLGEDQSLSNFEFAPDHEQDIVIDLNGCELRLKSEWIDYEDCEDITITITNTNEDDYGTLTYNDLSTSLVVAEDSELEFTEGEIPMDSDAACMVTIYRSSSSSTVLGTKVCDTLKEALSALEEQEEVIEDYDISSSYEDTFVIKMKLGEDQNLSTSTFTFAPDYDTTITIDLNGYTLKLKSEWIDYDDCEDLIVYVNNTNKDKKATLTYTDLSNSLSIAQGDSSLKFEEDEIPGIYDITISSATNGKVTASKTTVAHGGTVTFTITPNAGYAISTVKVGNKSITTSTSGYTVNSSTGVGTYKMEGITADVTITVTFMASSSSANWTNPFTDVTKNAQYYDAVAFVCSEGLFNGMTATKFEPMTTMTRAMFVTVLGRLADIDVSKYSGTSFTDVSKTDQQISWATPYIEWAVQNGITQGTGNGKFSPNDPITHQQMYLFMYRYALFVENITTPLTGVSLTSIRDAGEIADWAEEGVKFASKNGILITSGGKLTPADNALRCELAMLLEGFCTKVLKYN